MLKALMHIEKDKNNCALGLVCGNANAYFSDILPVISQTGVSKLQSIGSLLFVCLWCLMSDQLLKRRGFRVCRGAHPLPAICSQIS